MGDLRLNHPDVQIKPSSPAKTFFLPCRPHADLPLELMMQIAACMDKDADMRSLRAVNKQWKAAVDESVTRCACQALHLA